MMLEEDKLIDYLVGLDGLVWRDLASRISLWRSRGATIEAAPPEVLPYRHIVVDDTAWAHTKRRVASARRKAYRQRAGEQAEAARAQRREYMRGYMRDYRKTGEPE